MAFHWVVVSESQIKKRKAKKKAALKRKVVKIVVMIALAIPFGGLGIAIGLPAFIFAHKILGLGHGGDGAGGLLFGCMLVFGILGAVLGGRIGKKWFSNFK